ncbi:MAG: rod shape-determining protein [Planctomycetaceae bacterium]|nr:rod shape-determining protein [Planctomycetaceae bacterium]
MSIANVGIDLGTMYTVMAASNGCRKCIASEVGFPRDAAAGLLFDEKYVMGDDLRKHRKALNVIRPFKGNRLKSAVTEQDYRKLTDDQPASQITAATYLVKSVLDDLELDAGAQIRCVVGVPSSATIYSQKIIMSLVEKAAQLVAVVPEPFAVGFGLDSDANNSIIIDIGAGTVDYCYFYGAFPAAEDLKSLLVGGDHVDKQLRKAICGEFPDVKVSEQQAQFIKEKFGSVGSYTSPAVVELPTKSGRVISCDLTDVVRSTCQKFAEMIVENLISHLSMIESEDFAIENSEILLAGGGSQLAGLAEYIEDRLDLTGQTEVKKIHDSRFAGANGALQLARQLPDSYWEQLISTTTIEKNKAA